MNCKKKYLSLALVFSMLSVLLSGCFYIQSDSTIHSDGTGTIYYAAGVLADENEKPEDGVEVFEANGNKYYGTSKTETFASVEEFNKLFAAISEEDDNTNGEYSSTATLKKNNDGSLTLVFDTKSSGSEDEATSDDLAPETKEKPDNAELTSEEKNTPDDAANGLEDMDTDAMMKEAMAQAWICYTFTFDRNVRQIAGPTSPVKIEGGKLTIDLMKQSDEETEKVFVFQTDVDATVVPTQQKLSVNGVEKQTEIYNINGSNYFKLRDMAALLNGTSASFSVDYDAASQSILVKKGAAYTPNGTELVIPGADELGKKAEGAQKSSQKMLVDGAAVYLAPYNIGGNNFFALRDLGSALGFDVDYDANTKTMLVTAK